MASIQVHTDVPAGNGIIESVGGDAIRFRPDLRDTDRPWFYWHLAVNGAAGRRVRFEIAEPNTLTGRGPAASFDGGWTWQYLGREAPADQWRFTLDVPDGCDDARVSMGMPYTDRNLAAFLEGLGQSPHLARETLCQTPAGRPAHRLRVGRLDGDAPLRALITARHHCCEMMASYAVEGVIESVLADSQTGRWFRENVELMIVPFVDTDGVEAGDQGKARSPHDHNRDYEAFLYAETRAIAEQAPAWAAGRLRAAVDIHCPWIHGFPYNETIYLVGAPQPEVWQQQCRFGEMLESVAAGPLPYRAADNLPFGQSWNTAENYAGLSFSRWAATVEGVRLATSIELPYADAHGVEVNAESARSFGHDLAAGLRAYLQSLD